MPHLRARWWNVAWGLMAIELSWAARYSCSPSDLISQHSVTSPFTAPSIIPMLHPTDPVKCQTGLSVNGHHGWTMWTFLFILNFPLFVSSSGIIIGSKALRMGHYYVCASIELCKNTAPWCNGVVTKCLWPGPRSQSQAGRGHGAMFVNRFCPVAMMSDDRWRRAPSLTQQNIPTLLTTT